MYGPAVRTADGEVDASFDASHFASCCPLQTGQVPERPPSALAPIQPERQRDDNSLLAFFCLPECCQFRAQIADKKRHRGFT